MARNQAQGIVICQMCPNPVENHCNLCHVDLCSSCILEHMKDKTKRHEIVEFINRKKGYVLPECNLHKKTHCEMFCRDCRIPTCVFCVTTIHKKHDITRLREIIENRKQQIVGDLKELEDVIVPAYKNVTTDVSSAELDKVLTAIQDHEDEMCRMAHDIGNQMRDEVIKQKRKSEQQNRETLIIAAISEKELHKIINTSKSILKSSNATSYLNYESRNEKFRNGLKKNDLPSPIFFPGRITQDQFLGIFGGLKMSKKILETPVNLGIIQSPYGSHQGSKLWNVECDRKDMLWICGDDGKISQINKLGNILKTFETPGNVIGLAFNVHHELVLITGWSDTKIYKIKCDKVVALLNLHSWLPRGLCHTTNGDFLVSMRSMDRKRSKVVRYSGTTITQIIESSNQGKSLLSVVDESLLHLTENGKRDICVADYAGKAVVVVDGSGDLRFKYKGHNILAQLKYKMFNPNAIVSDINHHLLISDEWNNLVHIIDCDGKLSVLSSAHVLEASASILTKIW